MRLMNSDLWAIILTGVFGAGGLLGYVGQLLLARYSKSKQERDVGIANDYFSLSKLTVDELKEKMTLIGKLDDDVRKLQNENYLLKSRQTERDEQLLQMESRIVSLQAQIDTDARERADLRTKLSDFEVRNRVLWKYLIALLEQLKRHSIQPIAPPKELESDPEIVKLLNDNKEYKK